MTWADEIDHALRRCGSPYSAEDVLRWLREGKAAFAAHGSLHASLWFREDGCEIAHIAGTWNDEDARGLYAIMRREADARGVDFVEINGRPGWARFLRQKGFDHGC